MKTTFKAHPFMMYYFVKPFLFVFILPVLKGAIQYLIYKKITGVLFYEVLLLIGLFLIALMRLLAYKIEVDEDSLTVKRGIFCHQTAVIHKKRISSVIIDRTPLDFLLGSATFKINTEAGRIKTPDFKIKVWASDSKRLYTHLYGKDLNIKVKFPHVKVALMAAATSSAVTGLIVGVPVINQAGKMLGVSLSEVLFNEINTVSQKINTYTPPIVNLITIIVLAAYGFSFLVAFFNYLGFSLSVDDEKMEIRSGLFVKRHSVFKKHSINNICVEQTPIMRLFHVFSLCVSVAGYGDGKNERAIIIPCGSNRDIENMLSVYFPNFKTHGNSLKAPGNYQNGRRFLFVPTLLAVLVVATAIIEGLLFPEFISLVLFINSILMALVVYYGNICLKDFRAARISFGNNIFASSSVGISRRRIYVEKEKIGVIKITRTPADRKYNTCKVKLIVRSEGADSIRVKNIGYRSVCENIGETYGIKGIYRQNP